MSSVDGNDNNDVNRAGIKEIFGLKKKEKEKGEEEPKKAVVNMSKKAEIEVPPDIGLPKELRFKGKSQGILIINSFDGQGGNELLGYKHDEGRVRETFGKLNVDFHVERRLKGNKILPKIQLWLNMTEFKDQDCAVCVICSHGDDDGVIYGEDLNKVKLHKIKTMFINCEKLIGKPKLFFIQACRGQIDQQAVLVDESDIREASSEVLKAKDADVFQFFPTTPSHVSWVHPKNGSLFLNTVCKVLEAYRGRYPLQDIVVKVNEILSKEISYIRENNKDVIVCEASETTHSLTYKLFFNDSNNNTPVSLN